MLRHFLQDWFHTRRPEPRQSLRIVLVSYVTLNVSLVASLLDCSMLFERVLEVSRWLRRHAGQADMLNRRRENDDRI